MNEGTAGRARRRVEAEDAEAPEERSARRGCMFVGGILGVVAGVLLAFFVVPPLMNHYFGTADIPLGKEYRGDGRVLRVVDATRVPGAGGEPYPGVFEVRLEVQSNKTWTGVGAGTFKLELSTGEQLKALEADSDRPETSFDFPLGERRTLVLRFPGTERRDARPETLHVSDPRVRFHLEAD
jgi:hypothetical protein